MKTILQDLVNELNLLKDDGTNSVYGKYNGYFVDIRQDAKNGIFLLTFSVERDGLPNLNELKEFKNKIKSVKNIQTDGFIVEFSVAVGLNSKKFALKIKEALDLITENFKNLNYKNADQFTGKPEEDLSFYKLGDSLLFTTDEHFLEHKQKLDDKITEINNKNENVLTGLVGSALGALVGVLAIVILGQLGYVAAFSGIIMSVCAFKGYEILGGKLSNKGIAISVLIMIVFIYIGNKVSRAVTFDRIYIDLDFFQSYQLLPQLLDESVKQGYITSGAFKGDLFRIYAFSIIGVVPTILNTLRARKLSVTSYKFEK